MIIRKKSKAKFVCVRVCVCLYTSMQLREQQCKQDISA